MLRSIKSPQRAPRQLHFKVDGTGAASILIGSKDATLTDNGTGDYTLTFEQAFARLPVVVASSLTAGAVIQIASATASACQIVVKDTAGSALDADLMVIVQGFDAADEY
jgi:hypothetical protein